MSCITDTQFNNNAKTFKDQFDSMTHVLSDTVFNANTSQVPCSLVEQQTLISNAIIVIQCFIVLLTVIMLYRFMDTTNGSIDYNQLVLLSSLGYALIILFAVKYFDAVSLISRSIWTMLETSERWILVISVFIVLLNIVFKTAVQNKASGFIIAFMSVLLALVIVRLAFSLSNLSYDKSKGIRQYKGLTIIRTVNKTIDADTILRIKSKL